MSGNVEPTIPPSFPIAFDENATITTDIPCRKCGYNLRGLTHTGRCPECGTPVGLSTVGDLLRYSDPAWLLKLRDGMSFILWGILVAIIVSIAGAALRAALGAGDGLQEWVGVIAGLLGVYGAWLLTEPDPSGLGEAQYATSRKLVRVALLVGLAGNVMSAIAATIPVPGAVRFGVGLLVMGASLFGVVGEFAKFIYLEKLALRVPDDALAARARLLRWGYGLTLAALVVVGILAMILARVGGPTQGGRGGMAALGCFGGIVGIAFLVFGIMTLLFYFRMRRTLIAQEAAARAVWGSVKHEPESDPSEST